jgi:sterol desaturase/sphingolipid hydroxylase (fatty acid hydroxylase superfamily)
VVTFVLAFTVALVVRRSAVVGLAVVALVLVPLERAVPLRRQPVRRPGLMTDLTHFLVTGLLVSLATVVAVVVIAIPFVPLRRLDLEGVLPGWASVGLATAIVVVGSYWGHRLSHRIPRLWRFHSVHHSIEHMDWVAAARLHPVDAVVTQLFALVPLVVLGYQGRAVAGVVALVTALAIFQHANVRLRFPGLRWVLPTPEWHHWHHATNADAHDTNFGLPFVDKVFGTAFLPRDRRPQGFGVPDPVPADDYLGQLRYPLGDVSPLSWRDPVRWLI